MNYFRDYSSINLNFVYFCSQIGFFVGPMLYKLTSLFGGLMRECLNADTADTYSPEK